MSYNDSTRYKISSRLGLDSSSLSGKISIFIVILIILTSCLFYFSERFRYKVKHISDHIMFPVYGVLNAVNDGVIGTKDSFFNYINLEKKFRELQIENEELKSQNLLYKKTVHENELLRKSFRYYSMQSRKVLSTEIFSQSLGGYMEQARIAAGEKQGVHENDIVVAGDKLVGRVNKIGENTSDILLITGPSSKVSVFFTTTHMKGILRGSQNGVLVVAILHGGTESLPDIGETVVTSGDGYYFPSGILVGTVTRSEQDYIEITPFFDVKNIKIVSILRG